MADHALPVLTSTYTNFVSELDARFDDLAVGLDPAVTTATNVPTNSIRWSSAANTWQKWNGSSWVAWTSTLALPGAVTIAGNTTLGDASNDTVTVNGYMGVGGAANAAMKVAVLGGGMTGTNQYGLNVSPQASSAATSTIRNIASTVVTEAAAFTCASAYAYLVNDASKGAGSTITNLHGVYIADQTQGTNNYGITSLVSSGTNKWNIYASGTAANYFEGKSLIGTATAISSEQVQIQKTAVGSVANNLRLTNTGTTVGSGSGVLFGANTNAGVYLDLAGIQTGSLAATSGYLALGTTNSGVYAERLHINSSGNVGIGTSAPDDIGTNYATLDVRGTSGGGFRFGVLAGANSVLYADSTTSTWATTSALPVVISTNNTERLRIDSAGNLGLGVTPSAWGGSFKAIELIGGNSISAYPDTAINAMYLSSNAYFNGTNWIYKAASPASLFTLNDDAGIFKWETAPSGTAGNAITFTQTLAVGKGTTLALEGATSAAGTGIAFPATQLASSNANTLDDYEEGTWTPTVEGTTVAGAGTYTAQVGAYTKIGNVVTVTLTAIWSAHTGTGNIQVTGLPFVSRNTTNMYPTASIGANNLTFSNQLYAFVVTNTSKVTVSSLVTGATNSPVAMDTAASLYISATYFI